MNHLENLRNAKSIKDVAHLLGYKPSNLSYILYKIPSDKKYITFDIPKKSGGSRKINSPCSKLKEVQKRLAQLLFNCVEETLQSNERINDFRGKTYTRDRGKNALSHGFKSGLSIASNAELHTKKRFVLNLDLEMFFETINFGRVRGFFIKDRLFQLTPEVATIFAQIACHMNSLPQGSPCSPIISNLIGKILDVRLAGLAKKYTCTYTRYADDITFSTNLLNFPPDLAHESDSGWIISRPLLNCIEQSGFKINQKKTRMHLQCSRQIVTGLVVNRTVNIKSEYYRNARSMCHALFTSGKYFIPGSDGDADGSLNQLEGILCHIYHVKNYRNKFADEGYRKTRHDGYKKPIPENARPSYPPQNRCHQYSDKSHRVAIDGIKNLYSKFLFYKHFFGLQKPLVLCEGPTDNIYLRCAIKSLAASYPTLVKSTSVGLEFQIRFFNRTENATEMLKLAQGSSGLKFLAMAYDRLISRYSSGRPKYPVIIIVDNDKAGREIRAKGVTNQAMPLPTAPDNAFFISHNLYLIEIPKFGNKDTVIEDYFDQIVKATKVDNRSLNLAKTKINHEKFYGKSEFAKKVVQKQQHTINFRNFEKILDLIVKIIMDYKNSQDKISLPSTPASPAQ